MQFLPVGYSYRRVADWFSVLGYLFASIYDSISIVVLRVEDSV